MFNKRKIKIKVYDEFQKPVLKEWINVSEKSLNKSFEKIKRKFL